MIIKKVGAKIIHDSRGENTIRVFVKTQKGKFFASAPCGKSTSSFEASPYRTSIHHDVLFLNDLELPNIYSFDELWKIEKNTGKYIGANSLFALETALLRALGYQNKKMLFEFLSDGKKIKKFPIPIGNAIGGGVHSSGKKPDFQEFWFIAKTKKFSTNVRLNHLGYLLVNKYLKSKTRNDEGAWTTDKDNESVISVMDCAKDYINKRYGNVIDIGIDCAASSFYKNGFYVYKNKKQKLNKEKQIKYISYLAKKYNLHAIEDGLNENDFEGFRKLKQKNKNKLIIGDDLIATNPERLLKAIKSKSINAVIIKPNQIGSLLVVKKVIELAKKNHIKTIMSHRSGETNDFAIADLAIAWQCDYIKAGIFGKEREAKLKRLIWIEKNN